ncbi:MAG: hypothetical protein ACFFCQ_04085 [Promethearchaeota archaeon]
MTEFQDVITIKPDPIRIIRDKETGRLLEDPNYIPIFIALRRTPMTVKELEQEYNTMAVQKKSDKTLYRYLHVLKKANLVVPVGQRVVMGKTATETLYGRTAVMFQMMYCDESWLCGSKGQEMVKRINTLISKALDREEAGTKCLQKVLIEIASNEKSIIEGLVEWKQSAEFLADMDFREIMLLCEYVGLLTTLLKNPNIPTNLQSCYKEHLHPNHSETIEEEGQIES